MIIISHIRGGYRHAANYLNSQGKNEKIRTVEISDPDASNLDEAFCHMWMVASGSKADKPMHHISINPFEDECLSDAQMLAIVERCEKKYGYELGDHQRVIVEHIKKGRQHFHVFWNRVSLTTGKAVWPGMHWKKSIRAAREMEQELGLRHYVSRAGPHALLTDVVLGNAAKISDTHSIPDKSSSKSRFGFVLSSTLSARAAAWIITKRWHSQVSSEPNYKVSRATYSKDEALELLIWAWENKRPDILMQFGIILPKDYEF